MLAHANSQTEEGSDWNGFFDYFVADDLREKTLVSLKPGNPDTLLWHTFETDADDIALFKNRYSALIQGSSDLQKCSTTEASEISLSLAPRQTSAARRRRAMR